MSSGEPSSTSKDVVKVLSICQDIMNLSRRKLCTPKAFSLGLTIKHLTGSKEVITLLHRLGHCVSYDSILGYETSLAHIALSQAHDIPAGFVKGSLVLLVWDNIDFLEETKSGTGTTHHTNGIMIQAKQQLAQAQQVPLACPRGKARTIEPTPTVILPLIHHQRTNPTHLIDVEVPKPNNNLDLSLLEFAFVLARHQNDVTVPRWTGFNKIVRADLTGPQSSLNYFPVVESPPTDLDTVNHVLQASLDIADRFELDSLIVVFDQAIYCKAQ